MFGKKKRATALMTQLAETYREDAASGEGIVALDEERDVIYWEFNGAHCEILLPSVETRNIGLLESVKELEDGIVELQRFYFTNTGLLDVFLVVLSAEEAAILDENMIQAYMSTRQAVDGDQPISDQDQATFFAIIMSPFPGTSTR